MGRISLALASAALVMSIATQAAAQATEGAPAEARAGTIDPYDRPFRARSIDPRSYARIDTALATYSSGSARGYAMTQLFGFGIGVTDELVLHGRGGWAFSHEPSGVEGAVFANVEVGASWIARLAPEVRVGGHLSVFLPAGSAQGTMAPSHERRARQEGQRARFGIDAPLFATNELGFAVAGSLGWVHGGLVAQLELGLEPLIRVSGAGDEAALAVQGAVHVGYFVVPEWSLALELTHHQWAAGRPVGGSPDSVTAILVGTRAHATIDGIVLRPGLSYAHALGGTLQAADEHVVTIDVLAEL
jgi:opacity protein-like surface antigen